MSRQVIMNIRHIHLSFGGTNILNDINASITHGMVYTLTGGNGAGKTTLLNVLSGFLVPSEGEVLFKGKCINRLPAYKINRLGIGRTFQDLRLAMQLSVMENVLLAISHKMFEHYTKEHYEKAHDILARVGLDNKSNIRAREISYGQQKLLTIACLLANNAELLLIDEPVAGIDKSNFAKIVNLINELKSEGKTIIQIEHHPDYIRATNDILLRMENGGIIC